MPTSNGTTRSEPSVILKSEHRTWIASFEKARHLRRQQRLAPSACLPDGVCILVSGPQRIAATPTITPARSRVPENEQSTELVSHVDVMPTVLRAAGCAIPETVQGTDLTPYLEGTASGLRKAAFSEYGIPGLPYTPARLCEEKLAPGDFANPGNPAIPWEGNPVSLSGRIRMARTKDWKLVQEEGGTSELYDLRNDPHELTNLYDRSENGTFQTDLLNQLEEWKLNLPGINLDGTG